MKKMDIGDIRPREVIEVEDDKDQVLSNSNVQASGSWKDQDAQEGRWIGLILNFSAIIMSYR